MAKNKRELQAELEAANKRIAELPQSNQNANSNINNDEPPSWLKTFLEAQLSMQRQTQEQNVENQRQMQLESQRQMQQIIERFSQQQLALTWANYGPRAKSGPRACLIWPACYYHERVLKSNSLLIVEYSFPFPYRKITFQCPSIRIN